jgi:hypothetical protein
MYLPPNVNLKSNTTPVLGNIAGQLLRVNLTGTSTSIKLGPVKNYVPQKIYFKAGTSLTLVADQPNLICNQKIELSFTKPPPPHQDTFYGLRGSSTSTVVVNTPYGNNQYNVKANLGNYATITVKSPIEIKNKQKWEYAAELAG